MILRGGFPPLYLYLSGDIMKKLKTLLLILFSLLLLMMSCPLTAFSATAFDIEDGVLISYSGSERSVTIPSEVYYIADSAFEGNSSITSVNLNNTSVIGNKAFANCTSLSVVTSTDKVSSCGAYAFYNTPFQDSYSTKSLVLGSVLVSSSESGGVVIDSSVASIAPYAFVSNEKLTSVFIGDSVSSIGEGAFYGCSALKSVTVSKYVSYIGAFAFEDTPYLSSVEDEFLVLGNGILVDASTSESEVVIPENVRQIASGAFYKNKNIESIVVSEGVTAIGMRAFSECTALKNIELPSSLVSIDNEAFSGCAALQNVVIPRGVKLIGDSAFLGCTSLQTAVLRGSADVPAGLFAGCSSLESVMLSNGITSIGEYAFYNCSSLFEISVPATVESIATSAFSNAGEVSVWCKLNSYANSFCEDKDIPYYSIGDANLDGVVNVRDATEVQKATASLVSMSFSANLRGDADFNGEINVRDATTIQKIVAGIE